MPNAATPWLIFLTAPNTPLRLIPANQRRSSFTLSSNIAYDIYFSLGAPTIANGMPIGIPISPGQGNFTFLAVSTLLSDIWVWATNGNASFNGAIAGNQLTVNSFGVAGGVMGLGQLIAGPGVPANTYIVAYGTGDTGIGTYYLSTSSTVAAENMTATIFPLAVFGYEMIPALDAGEMENQQ